MPTMRSIMRAARFLIPAGAVALALWFAWPTYLLWRAERSINQVYGQYRPFIFRWSGAPYAAERSSGKPAPQDALMAAMANVQSAERRLGRTVESLRLTARTYLLLGAPDRALADCRLAMLLADASNGPRLEFGMALALRAVSQNRAFDYEQALETLLAASQESDAPPEAHFNAALVLEQIPMPHEALAQWKRAAKSEPSIEWSREVVNHMEQVELLIARRARLGKGLLDLSSEVSDGDYLTPGAFETAVNELVPLWLENRSNREAEGRLKRLALLLEQKAGDRWLGELLEMPRTVASGQAARDLAGAMRANVQGKHVKAEELARSAERGFQGLRNKAGVMKARLEYVYSLHRRSDAVRCLDGLSGFRPDARKRHYVWMQGQAWLDEITCVTLTRKADVLEETERAYEWTRGTAFQGLQLRALSFLSQRYQSFGNPLQLWSRGREGLAMYWNGAMPGLRAHGVYFPLGIAAENRRLFRAKAAMLRESIEALGEGPNRKLVALILSNLGETEARAGRKAEAAEAFERAGKEFKKMDAAETAGYRVEAEVASARADLSRGDSKTGLSRLRAATRGRSLPYLEFNVAERITLIPTMGDALLASGDIGAAVAHYSLVVEESLKNLSRISKRAQRASTLREAEPAWRGLAATRIRQGDPSGALEIWKRFQQQRTGLAGGQLPAGVVALCYAFLPGGLSGWVWTPQGIEQRWIDAPEVAADADRMASMAADPACPLSAVEAVSGKLYAALIQPFEGQLRGATTVMISADGPLARVPWAALTDDGGRPLVQRAAVIQNTGLGLERGSPWKADLRHEPMLIVADPALGPDLAREYPRLVDAVAEAVELQSRFPGAVVLRGADARADAWRKMAQTVGMMHFAGHGVSNGGFGGLLLAGETKGSSGRMLTAREVADLDLRHLSLAVLAACSSGVGEQAGLVNLESLVSALRDAGVGQVVAAGWEVHSRSTRTLMGGFYRGVGQGVAVAESLRRAALLVRNDPAFRHPYYWAAFQVFGEPLSAQ